MAKSNGKKKIDKFTVKERLFILWASYCVPGNNAINALLKLHKNTSTHVRLLCHLLLPSPQIISKNLNYKTLVYYMCFLFCFIIFSPSTYHYLQKPFNNYKTFQDVCQILGYCHSYGGLLHLAFSLVANNSSKLWKSLTTTHTLLLFKEKQGYVIKRWWAQIQDEMWEQIL